MSPTPVLNFHEVEASKNVLDALRDIEKQVCHPEARMALPVNLSWTVIFEFISIAQKILTNPAVQAVIKLVAPQLAAKLVQLEQQVQVVLKQIQDWLSSVVPVSTSTSNPPVSHP